MLMVLRQATAPPDAGAATETLTDAVAAPLIQAVTGTALALVPWMLTLAAAWWVIFALVPGMRSSSSSAGPVGVYIGSGADGPLADNHALLGATFDQLHSALDDDEAREQWSADDRHRRLSQAYDDAIDATDDESERAYIRNRWRNYQYDRDASMGMY